MEQPCYKCGQVVEEGRPFCPHCTAPQIRVVVAEPVSVTAAYGELPGLSGKSDPLPASETVPVLALPTHWSKALKPCVLAAVVASVLMALGLHPFVAMFSVGFLAVVLYRQRQPEVELRGAAGARLGALSGLLWFAVSSILETVVVLMLHKGPELRKQMMDAMDQAASRTANPQALEMFKQFKTPNGLEFLMIAAIIFGFVMAIVLGAMGGATAGVIFGRRNRG